MSTDRVRDLYEANVEAIFAYLARRVGRELAGDLTADTFRAAIEGVDRFDASLGSQRSWLFGIATNLLRRHWRTEQRRLRALGREAGADGGVMDPLLRVVERVDAASDVDRLLGAVSALKAEDRDLLVLIAWEGCAHREVADILQIPMGTVRSRLHRIRTELRAAMGAGKEDEDG